MVDSSKNLTKFACETRNDFISSVDSRVHVQENGKAEAFLVLRILSMLNHPKDICACSMVRRTWRVHVAEGPLWRILDLRGQPNAAQTFRMCIQSPLYRTHLVEFRIEFDKDFDDSDLSLLQNCEVLTLNAVHGVTSAGLQRLPAANPTLVHLDLYWQPETRDKLLENLAHSCPNLTALNISGSSAVTDRGLRALSRAPAAGKLLSLNLTRCQRLTERGLGALAVKAIRLRSLNLYSCGAIDETGHIAIGRHCSFLQHLDLCGHRYLTNAALTVIAEGCGYGLLSLILTWCVLLDDIGCSALAKACTRLRVLSLYGIVGVTDVTISGLAATPVKDSLRTLDVSGCVGIQKRSRPELLAQLPSITCFQVHS